MFTGRPFSCKCILIHIVEDYDILFYDKWPVYVTYNLTGQAPEKPITSITGMFNAPL